MSDETTVVGLLTVELYLPEAQTLKDKRSVVKGLLARLSDRLNVSVAEVGALDRRRTAVVAVAAVANDSRHVQRVLDACRRLIESEPRAMVQDASLELL
ncbi:MAG: DUF503 domain-containing protein [Armatimonadetes bacterium]|nr:DUF503 domain-containing protein [Armatimonadota bacterium]